VRAGEGGVKGVEGEGVGFVVFVDIGFGLGVVRGGMGRIQIRSLSLLCCWLATSHWTLRPD
jgi:hypothetical protein